MTLPRSVAAVVEAIAKARPYPSFDPNHADEEILGAWVRVQDFRTWLYHEDDVGGPDAPVNWPEDVAQRLDDEHLAIESLVTGNWATTPAGVAARLALLMPSLESSRWVDRCVMADGIRALYLHSQSKPKQFDGTSQQVLQAAYELQCMEWQQALDEYERSIPAYKLAPDIVDAIGELRGRHPELADELAPIFDLAKANEQLVSNHAQIDRLMKTLVVEPDELPRKMQIMMTEGLVEEAAPWLLRDVTYLNAKSTGSEEA